MIDGLYSRLKETLVIKRADDPVGVPSESKETFLHEIGSQLIIDNSEDGFKMVFGHELLFEEGNTEIDEDMKWVLQKIAKFMRVSAYQVYIDGHADNIPVNNGEYQSNMDLSLTRALNIMDYFVRQEGISPGSIALAGYGEFHPASKDDTPSGRMKNRRVEIIFKNKSYF